MAGSVELKLEEYNNDDDAASAMLTIDGEDISVMITDKEYDQAAADLDDMINKLQGIKNYVDTLVEGK